MTIQRRLDQMRRHGRQKRQRVTASDSHDVSEPVTPSVIAMGREERERLRSLIDDLPRSLGSVLQLRLDGMDYAEIANEVGLSEANARQRVSRCIKVLRERWRGKDRQHPAE